MNNSNRLKIDGLLYLFIGNLIENNKYMDKENSNTQVDEYINISIDFINNNYSNNIKVNDIANYVGLNRSYFSNLFTKKIGISPQEYLLSLKMEKACNLLTNLQLSIGDVARQVGYEDQLTFSKIFKKSKGVSPKLYRELLL